MLGCASGTNEPPIEATVTSTDIWNFDDDKVGDSPGGWTAESTNPSGPVGEWSVEIDPSAPSPKRVLSLTKVSNDSSNTFNILWTKKNKFQNGHVAVLMRADDGVEDQGGGLIWRVVDASNYYVTRYNPLEKNLRVYVVKSSVRTTLQSVENLEVETGDWFNIAVKQVGEKIQVSLNGKLFLNVTDATFLQSGGAGIWTKADAKSSFDNLIMESYAP